MKTKFILYFLAALLIIFIIKAIFVGVWLFFIVLKYMAIAALVAYVVWWCNKQYKKHDNDDN